MSNKMVVSEDLASKSPVVQIRTLWTAAAREKHVEISNFLLKRLKHEDVGQGGIFSGEKFFTADATMNRRNTRHLADLPVSDVDPFIQISLCTKAPVKVMVL